MATPPKKTFLPPAMTVDELKVLAATVGLLISKIDAVNNVAIARIRQAGGNMMTDAAATLRLRSARRSPFKDPETALKTITDPGFLSVDEHKQLMATLPQAVRASLVLAQDPSLPIFWGFSSTGGQPPKPNQGESPKQYVFRVWPQIAAFKNDILFGMLVIALGLISDKDVDTDESVDDMLERRLSEITEALMKAQQQLMMLKLLLTKLEQLKKEKADALAHGKPWTPPNWKDLVAEVQAGAKPAP